jgi:hypothetical protein
MTRSSWQFEAIGYACDVHESVSHARTMVYLVTNYDAFDIDGMVR